MGAVAAKMLTAGAAAGAAVGGIGAAGLQASSSATGVALRVVQGVVWRSWGVGGPPNSGGQNTLKDIFTHEGTLKTLSNQFA